MADKMLLYMIVYSEMNWENSIITTMYYVSTVIRDSA